MRTPESGQLTPTTRILFSTMPERRTAAPATDQTTQQHSDTKPETEKKSWLDLSPIQVMGGALAAMTAAGLGSRFSVEGTVVGAAMASVIAAVAGGLYTASLRRTSAAVRGVLGARRIPSAWTKGLSAPKPVPSGSTAAAPQSRSTAGAPARRRSLVLSSVVGAGVIFALAGGALTMYEAIAGQALSGGSGTTFSQVQQDGSEDRPTDERSPAPTDSAEPGESVPTPTANSSDTPEAESAPTAEPSGEPSTEPSATEEVEPSATAEPPSAAPTQTAQTPR
jgi:hypothetical protein